MTRATSGNLLFSTGAAPRRAFKPRAPIAPTWRKLEPGAVVLAIDPSVQRCGWSILRFADKPDYIDSGVFHPKQSDERDRLDDLSRLIAKQIKDSRDAGDVITDALIEIPRGGGMSGEPLLTYGQAVGACAATCYRAGLRMHRVKANAWRANTSNCKEVTARIVRATFKGCAATENNQLDAIGLAIWLCERSRMIGQ